MSVRIMTRVWDAEFPTTSMKLVALKLADCANDEGENIYPSIPRVERETGVSASSVREAIADMEASGLIAVISEGTGNKRAKSTTTRGFDVDRLRALIEKRVSWAQLDVPVCDQKTGEQKTAKDGSPKTRKAWRLISTPPATGGATPPATGGDPSSHRRGLYRTVT